MTIVWPGLPFILPSRFCGSATQRPWFTPLLRICPDFSAFNFYLNIFTPFIFHPVVKRPFPLPKHRGACLGLSPVSSSVFLSFFFVVQANFTKGVLTWGCDLFSCGFFVPTAWPADGAGYDKEICEALLRHQSPGNCIQLHRSSLFFSFFSSPSSSSSPLKPSLKRK